MLVRILAATVVGGIAFFFIGWLIYGVLLAQYMKDSTISYPGLMKEPMPDMVPLILANLVIAGLFAFVFEYWATIRTFVGGMKGGAIMMFLIALYIDLNYMAFMNIMKGFTPLIVDVLAATVIGAIVGGLIGLVLGKMDKGTAAA